MSTRAALVALAAAVALQAGLSVHALRGQSATFDEGAHLPAGYTYLALGDHRLNPEQPPLVKLIAAAPLLVVRPAMRTDDRAWAEARQWEFGRRFLYRWNDGDRLLFLGRLPIVALASCLVAAVFFETRRRFSPPAAAVAAFLAALSPEVLAHGSIVTTDLAFALFFFLSVAAFDRALARASAARWLAAGLATGAAFATKFSAPILAPVFVALLLAAVGGTPRARVASRRPRAAGGRGGHRPPGVGRLRLLARAHARSRPARRAAHERARRVGRGAGRPRRGRRVAGVPRAGGLRARRRVRDDALGGTRDVPRRALSERGFPAYFLFTIAATRRRSPCCCSRPLPWRACPGCAGATPRSSGCPSPCTSLSRSCAGCRSAIATCCRSCPSCSWPPGEASAALLASRRQAPRVAAVALALWYAAGTLRDHPHHLAYFNEIAGGPANGYRHLVDSNLDWGQDLKRLAAWARASGKCHR